MNQTLNNLSNTSLILFLTGFSLPIVLYILSSTSFENLLNKLTFWKWKKTSKITALTAAIIIINTLLFSTFTSARQTTPSSPLSQDSTHANLMARMPGMDGDHTKRYTVSFIPPENIQPDQDTQLLFTVNDANNGNPTQLFKLLYEKISHLIIVDSELKFFNHIHPTREKNTFLITTRFPNPGTYHLYLDFQPWGAIEQQFAFTLNVGNIDKPTPSENKPDTENPKTFGNYKVMLTAPSLDAIKMSTGRERIIFTILDSKTNQPVTTLKPYLAAFGHLTLINQETYNYLHAHPITTNWEPVPPDKIGGPDVEFIPMSIYSPIKPGIYRAFAQFNPDGNLFTADFTLEITSPPETPGQTEHLMR